MLAAALLTLSLICFGLARAIHRTNKEIHELKRVGENLENNQ
jgi:hypothetical protein